MAEIVGRKVVSHYLQRNQLHVEIFLEIFEIILLISRNNSLSYLWDKCKRSTHAPAAKAKVN